MFIILTVLNTRRIRLFRNKSQSLSTIITEHNATAPNKMVDFQYVMENNVIKINCIIIPTSAQCIPYNETKFWRCWEYRLQNRTDIIHLILIILFSVIYWKSAILFGAAALLCSISIVGREWLLLWNKCILQVFNTVNIINKVHYKVCRISCYIRKTFMKIWSDLRQFYIHGKIHLL